MKRRRRTPLFKPSDLAVEKSVATELTADSPRPRSTRYSSMKLPHERDESTSTPGTPRKVTEQAARDVDAGQADTDRYGETGERFDRAKP
jgi:hypothetical protein